MAADFATMDQHEFRRAYLNIWTKTAHRSGHRPRRLGRAWPTRHPTLKTRSTFAVDVTPDRWMASIAAAGRRPDGLVHLEIVDH